LIIEDDTMLSPGYVYPGFISGSIIYGSMFKVDAFGTITHYIGTKITSPGIALRLWSQTAGLLSEVIVSNASLTANAWNEVALPSPVAVSPQITYCVACNHKDATGASIPSVSIENIPPFGSAVVLTGERAVAGLSGIPYDYTIDPFGSSSSRSQLNVSYGSDVVFHYSRYTQAITTLYEATSVPPVGVEPTVNPAVWQPMLSGFDRQYKFEEADFTSTFTCGPYTSVVIPIRMSLIGRTVSMFLSLNSWGSATGTASVFNNNTLIPFRFRPTNVATNVLGQINVLRDGVWTLGTIEVKNTGQIIIYGGVLGATFGTGFSNGFHTVSLTWQI
jgi:hypothetical protein